MAESTLKKIMEFFGMSPSEFTKDWKKLTTEDKAQIREGIENGTLTY